MKITVIKALALSLLVLKTALAQPTPPPSENVTIAKHALDHEGMISCAYADLLIEQLEFKNQDELMQEIQSEYQNAVRDFQLNPPASSTERKLKQRMIKDLKILSHSNDPKPKIKNVFQKLCEISIASGGAAVRTTALAAATVTSAITLPLRLVFKFGRGVVTADPDPARRGNLNKFLGDKMGQSISLLPISMLLRTSIFLSSPLLMPVLAIPAVDYFASKRCAKLNENNPNDVRFCRHYQKIKDFEYEVTAQGDRGGASVIKWWGEHSHYRSQKNISQSVCNASVKRQVKIGIRVMLRNRDKLKAQNPEIYDIKVQPPEPNGCVAILIETNNVDDVATVSENVPAVIDGIRVIVTYCEDPHLWTNNIDVDPEKITEEQFCSYLAHWNNIHAAQAKPLESYAEVLRLMVNPQALNLKHNEVEVPDDKLYRLSFDNIGKFRNVAFLFTPSQEDMDSIETLRPAFEQLKQEVKAENKKYKLLLKQKNVAACESLKKELNFNFNALIEKAKSLSQYEIFTTIQDVRALRKSYRTAGKSIFLTSSLKLNWELVEISSKQELHEELMRGDIVNAVFISHGYENGKLVDGNHDIVPQNFFSNLPPSIMSLNFYSCHSSKAPEVYHLDEVMKSTASYYPLRIYNYLGEMDTILQVLQDSAVNSGLGNYFSKIDRRLYEAMQGNQRLQALKGIQLKSYEPSASCRLVISGFDVTVGGFGISLNSQYFIGALPKTQRLGESYSFSFPCNELEQGENVFMIKNESFIHITERDGSQVNDPTAIRANLILESGESRDPTMIKPIIREYDRNIKSVRITF